MRYIFLLLVLCQTLSAQTSIDRIHENMLSQDSRFAPYTYNDFNIKCPWQSVRVLTHAHWQIEIRGSFEEINSLDIALIQRDLSEVWKGAHSDSYELIDRQHEIDFHTSIPYWPLQRWFDWEYDQVGNALDLANCPSPCSGFEMRALPNGLIYGIREYEPGKFQISFVRFVKWRSGPKYKATTPEEIRQDSMIRINYIDPISRHHENSKTIKQEDRALSE